jgi:DNA polymerase alpha subunit A
MKARGQSAKAGDVIPYVFCTAEGEETASGKAAQADRARHPDEVRKSGSGLQIGTFERRISENNLLMIGCQTTSFTFRIRFCRLLKDCVIQLKELIEQD